MDTLNDKYSIKNLLFTKALPNYVIPVPVNGHKVFPCTDCGDKFILESSYEYHINRKSVKISYMCRLCGKLIFFYNRCNLLSHIRSHAFKTATINVIDLKLEPLPLDFFAKLPTKLPSPASSSSIENSQVKEFMGSVCLECQKNITSTGQIDKDRAKHYMEVTKEVYSCPVCLFALPTICGLRAHLRIHLKCAPFYCSECGISLTEKSVIYPYNHHCEGFKMMRATARLQCPISECPLMHPSQYKDHLRSKHLKKVYKCQFCFVACFSETIMENHLRTHKSVGKSMIFYQCELCPGKLVLSNQVDNHLRSHIDKHVNPCWTCNLIFKEVSSLIEHYINVHGEANGVVKKAFLSILKNPNVNKSKKIYRVVKKCDQCKRNFTYKCKFEQIELLPNECPFKCSSNLGTVSQTVPVEPYGEMTCHLCQNKISQNWEEIKKHYAAEHKAHRCVDINIVLNRLNRNIFKNKSLKTKSQGSMRRKRTRNKPLERGISAADTPSNKMLPPPPPNKRSQFDCNKCDHQSETKELFEKHMIIHRDPYMAYQCMECGQCFVVKPSFSKHMLLDHGLADIEDYIVKKQCFNENALMKYQPTSETNEPLRENQCRICRDQFNNADDLEKHFRVHGMAFLLKNNSNKTSP